MGGPVGITIRLDNPDSETNFLECVLVTKHYYRENLAMHVGDIIHTLRAALDYAATAVVRSMGADTQYVTFPFHEKKESLTSSQSTGIKALKRALPHADVEGFFQDEIQPFKSGNSDLWTLTKLDKVQKHNFILPSVVLSNLKQIGTVEFVGASVKIENINLIGEGDFVLYRGPVKGGNTGDYDFSIEVQLFFPEDSFWAGEPIIPKLANLCGMVEQTLFKFEQFAVKNGAPVSVTKADSPQTGFDPIV